jgi:hypothetical protein
MGKRETLQKVLRRHRRPCGKKPVKMEWTQSRPFRQRLKVGLLGVTSVEVPND